MIEYEIEQKALNKFRDSLQESGIDMIQTVGSFQMDEIKAVEQSDAVGFLIVKAHPRSYQTPTVPTCQIEFDMSLTIRSDVDYKGKKFLDVSDIVVNLLERWQKCLCDVHEIFTVENKFKCTGFQLGTGDTSIDAQRSIWQYNHSFTVFGVVQN